MPIKIPNLLPATQVLLDENIFVMTETRAMTQDIRPLRIVMLNLMPQKIVTETQIARLIGKDEDIAEYEQKIEMRKKAIRAAYFNTHALRFAPFLSISSQGRNIKPGRESSYLLLSKRVSFAGKDLGGRSVILSSSENTMPDSVVFDTIKRKSGFSARAALVIDSMRVCRILPTPHSGLAKPVPP